jgi:hypothetical protein
MRKLGGAWVAARGEEDQAEAARGAVAGGAGVGRRGARWPEACTKSGDPMVAQEPIASRTSFCGPKRATRIKARWVWRS